MTCLKLAARNTDPSTRNPKSGGGSFFHGQGRPNPALQETATAIPVPREFKWLTAAAAAERGHSAPEGAPNGGGPRRVPGTARGRLPRCDRGVRPVLGRPAALRGRRFP